MALTQDVRNSLIATAVLAAADMARYTAGAERYHGRVGHVTTPAVPAAFDAGVRDLVASLAAIDSGILAAIDVLMAKLDSRYAHSLE